jgi:hypothetical protein
MWAQSLLLCVVLVQQNVVSWAQCAPPEPRPRPGVVTPPGAHDSGRRPSPNSTCPGPGRVRAEPPAESGGKGEGPVGGKGPGGKGLGGDAPPRFRDPEFCIPNGLLNETAAFINCTRAPADCDCL